MEQENNNILKLEQDGFVEMPSILGGLAEGAYGLPGVLSEMVGLADSLVEKDMLLIGSLVTVSACLPGLTGIYDGRRYGPNLYAFISAPPATGKGCLMLARHLVEPVNDALVMAGEQRIEQWRQEKGERQVAGPRGGEERPPITTLLIPANSSSSAFLEMLWGNNGRGLMHETEADVMTYAIKMDMGNYSPALRAAYQHESLAFSRRRNNEKIYIPRPYLSVLLSGTPAQVHSLIPDTENGLFSRFLFWCARSRMVWKDVFGKVKVDDDDDDNVGDNGDRARRIGERVLRLYRYCETHPMEFLMRDEQAARFNAFFDKLQDEQSQVYGEEIVPSIRRMGVSAYRIMMVLGALRLVDKPVEAEVPGRVVGKRGLWCEDRDLAFVLHMMGVMVAHTDHIYLESQTYKQRRDRAVADLQKQLNLSEAAFYDHLPRRFETKRAIEIGVGLGFRRTSCFQYLKKLVYQNLIKHKRHGEYEK